MEKAFYSKEQLQRFSRAHQKLCAFQNINPQSKPGRDMALLLLEQCTGEESEEIMVAKVSH